MMNRFSRLVIILIVGTLLASCTFTRPGIEEPPINNLDERIPKSFFVNSAKANGKTDPKTFLCAWAPIREREYAHYWFSHGAATQTMHCNIEWVVTESAVVGHQVNPSYPDDRSQWTKIISIPIESHYHYEAAIDNRGRDTNRLIKNTQRDPWNRRPYMDLNLKNIQFHAGYMNFFGKSTRVIDVREIEWDNENGFLGFTVEAMHSGFSSELQGQFRVNFKTFNHNPDFKKTPYHERNSRFLNAIHILGKKVEGTEPVLYAGHWDVTKTHTLYLNGFPEHYRKIAVEAVEDWNNLFQELDSVPEGHKPFVVADKELEYPLDLRYPTINWVDDRKISAHSGLGIGLASADVRNGEILWGGVVLYGGLIDRFVRAYTPSSSFAAQAPVDGLHLHKFFNLDQTQGPIRSLFGQSTLDYMVSPEGLEKLNLSISQMYNTRMQELESLRNVPTGETSEERESRLARIAELTQSLNSFARTTPQTTDVTSFLNSLDFSRYIQEDYLYKESDGILPEQKELFERDFNLSSTSSINFAKHYLGEDFNEISPQEQGQRRYEVVNQEITSSRFSHIFDADRSINEIVPQWHSGFAAQVAQGKTIDQQKAADAVVKALTLHEIGHFLGLGHQFKANFLPKEGSVPSKYMETLTAMAEDNYKNYTSVMDYSSGRTEILYTKEELVPGPHDKLVMKYLYDQKYPVFKAGMEDFEYEKVPENGLIPDEPTSSDYAGMKTTYFEACSDIEASLAMDPYCRRWDRGYDALTIAQSIMEDYKENLVYSLNAFTSARGDNPNRRLYYLWYHSLRSFSHARSFYDEMRFRIDNNPTYANAFGKIRSNQGSLYNFSKYCLNPELAPAATKDAFKTLSYEDGSSNQKSEIHSLCEASQYVLMEFKKLLERKGSDYNIVDYDAGYVASGISGGDISRDWGSIFGRYKEISFLPVRLSALLAITTPSPWFMWGPWQIPIERYSNTDARYSMQTLFPYEFMGAINAAVKNSLRFGGTIDQESAEMGRLMFYLPSFLFSSNYLSNDKKNRFPQDYIDNLRSQTQFNFRMTPVLLSKLDPPQGRSPTRVFKFKTTYMDFAKRQEIDLPYAFLLPEGRVLAKGLEGQFFLPMTRFRFVNDTFGYIWSLEMNYTSKHDDPLTGVSVRSGIDEEYQSILRNCVNGDGDGLNAFFNETNNEFVGFEVLSGIATDKGLRIRFEDSVKTSFDTYWETSNPQVCEETMKGIGLIISSSALLNGFFTQEAFDYILW